jgi:uncharacterized SAM-binding protein YcdF (DUF218 family)
MKRGKVRIVIVLAGLLAVWIAAAPFLANALIVERPLGTADAILVLGGSYTYRERTEKAAELFNQGIAPRIYLTDDGEVSGWAPNEATNPSFVELARRSLVAKGVPADRIIILQPRVTGTIHEARLLSETARVAGLKSVLIVTSAYHTRRALWTFQRVFSENEQSVEAGIASPSPGKQTPRPIFWWLSTAGWNFVAGEYVKIAVYSVYH